MGQDAGFLALEVAVSTGAEYVVVPEIQLDIQESSVTTFTTPRRGRPFSHHLAEGVMSALELKNRLQDTGGYDARVTVLGAYPAGGSPSSFDTVLASRMGALRWNPSLRANRGHGHSICGQMTLCLEDAWKSPEYLNPELLALVEKLSVLKAWISAALSKS